MRKHISIILALVVALSLIGCSESDMLALQQATVDTPVAAEELLEDSSDSKEQTLPEDDYILIIDSTSINKEDFGTFNRNITSIEVDDMSLAFYKVHGAEDEDSLVDIYPYIVDETDGTYPGFMGNLTSLNQITAIELAFSEDTSGEFELLYGNDKNNLEFSYELSAEDFAGDLYFLDEPSSYFRIETIKDTLTIDYLVLHLNSDLIDETQEYHVDVERIVPEVNYNPKEGDTLKAPVESTYENGVATVTKWKEYTYHSFDYCRDQINKGADPAEYALTEPIDVANYFILFNRIPANYGFRSGKSNPRYNEINGATAELDEVSEVFGALTRQVSEYTYSDGYSRLLPCNNYPEKSNRPLYYEFDISLEKSYNTFRYRGTARVIGYVGGFSSNSDDTNVAMYTDDHYTTMMEYSNNGFWNDRFDTLNESITVMGKIY